jgi:asparagine synthase (glutamine-hydrolysing)
MSGILSLVNLHHEVDVSKFLYNACQQMSHLEWHKYETWISPDLPMGIGRIHIDIFNREHQPVSFNEGKYLTWFCGELYHTQALAQKLDISLEEGLSDPLLALIAYLRYGQNFPNHLNGVFFIVIYDIQNQSLIIANDRYGLYPHYYHASSQQLVFAPEVKGVLCAPGLPRTLNLTAASEYFRFQQILGEKTFHEDISLFPYGSIAQFDLRSGHWSIQRYWDWDQIPYRPELTFDEAVEEAGCLLQQAVVTRSEGIRPGVFLSGGLDSRSLLGFLPHHETKPISITYGNHDSRDVVYAQHIAKTVGSNHHWFDIPNGQWILDNIDLHLKLTEGFHSWIHMHGINVINALRPLMDCNLSGWDGGTVMGHPDHINPIYNYPVDEWTVGLHTYQQFTQAYTWPGLTDAEEKFLITTDFARQATGSALESLLYEFSRFWQFRKEYAGEYFYLVNHCCRFTFHMNTIVRSTVEARFPFWDYDLLDFIYSLPPILRRDQLLFRTIITQRLPRLALIPYDKQEYLPSINPLINNVHKMTVRGLKKLKLFPDRTSLYVDYENYLRNDVREWAEDILFDRRTAQRGIFDIEFVRSLMNRHLAGKENWVLGKIAHLITFELVMRKYFD